MKDEIKEILDRLERIDHKEYIAFEFADSATFNEMARCFEERKKMADYITNLQEENKRLKVDKETIKRWYKLCKSRNEKAVEYIKNDLIPFGDEWHWDEGGIGYMVEDVLNILEGDKDE